MTETKKPRFRHIAVNGKNNKTGAKYAKDLTEAMNSLIEDGFSVQLNECKNFTVVMGIRPETETAGAGEHPFARMMRLRAEAAQAQCQESAPVQLTPRTRELLMRFERLPGLGTDMDHFLVEARTQAASLTRGFNPEELRTATTELEAARAGHDETCGESRALKVIIEALRGVVHTSVS